MILSLLACDMLTPTETPDWMIGDWNISYDGNDIGFCLIDSNRIEVYMQATPGEPFDLLDHMRQQNGWTTATDGTFTLHIDIDTRYGFMHDGDQVILIFTNGTDEYDFLLSVDR